jgi:hypothetical protein
LAQANARQVTEWVLEILGRNGDLLKDRARLSELWNAFLAAEPKLLTGFSGIHESDQAGILIIDTGEAWLTGHASDLSVKFPEIGSSLPVSLSGTLFFFSYILIGPSGGGGRDSESVQVS